MEAKVSIPFDRFETWRSPSGWVEAHGSPPLSLLIPNNELQFMTPFVPITRLKFPKIFSTEAGFSIRDRPFAQSLFGCRFILSVHRRLEFQRSGQ